MLVEILNVGVVDLVPASRDDPDGPILMPHTPESIHQIERNNRERVRWAAVEGAREAERTISAARQVAKPFNDLTVLILLDATPITFGARADGQPGAGEPTARPVIVRVTLIGKETDCMRGGDVGKILNPILQALQARLTEVNRMNRGRPIQGCLRRVPEYDAVELPPLAEAEAAQ